MTAVDPEKPISADTAKLGVAVVNVKAGRSEEQRVRNGVVLG